MVTDIDSCRSRTQKLSMKSVDHGCDPQKTKQKTPKHTKRGRYLPCNSIVMFIRTHSYPCLHGQKQEDLGNPVSKSVVQGAEVSYVQPPAGESLITVIIVKLVSGPPEEPNWQKIVSLLLLFLLFDLLCEVLCG